MEQCVGLDTLATREEKGGSEVELVEEKQATMAGSAIARINKKTLNKKGRPVECREMDSTLSRFMGTQ